jgi:hypothetical protein
MYRKRESRKPPDYPSGGNDTKAALCSSRTLRVIPAQIGIQAYSRGSGNQDLVNTLAE